MYKVTITKKPEELDNEAKAKIREKYELEDELKILRQTIFALITKKDPPHEFLEYYDFIEEIITRNKKYKMV